MPGYFVNSPTILKEPSRRLTYIDITLIPSVPGDFYNANHVDQKQELVGGNALFLDGHVDWLGRDDLTVETVPLPPGKFLFPNTN